MVSSDRAPELDDRPRGGGVLSYPAPGHAPPAPVPYRRYVLGEEFHGAVGVVGRGRCAVTPGPAGFAVPDGPLRADVETLAAKGGTIRLACRGGTGAVTLLWTASEAGRGYALLLRRPESRW
jgi:hypothetical protein